MEAAVRACLEQAHRSLLAGGLAVGACFTDEHGVVIATGRNRAYDPPGGTSVLQGNRLAHAELNVLAELPVDRDPGEDEVLWSTQQPCSMCDAAAVFTGVRSIRWLSDDPWATAAGIDQSRRRDGIRRLGPRPDDRRVVIVAAGLFVASIIAMSGAEDHPTAAHYRAHEPAIFAAATAYVLLAQQQRGLDDFLSR